VHEFSDFQYSRISQLIDGYAGKYLRAKNFDLVLKNAQSSVGLNELRLEPSNKAATVTANFALWSSFSRGAKIQLSPTTGLPVIKNSDKVILIKFLGCLEESGRIIIQKNVVIVNEGCDNGDYLMLMIPLLRKLGAENIKIILVNGNENKLRIARKIGAELLSEKDSFAFVENSFDGVPSALEGYEKMGFQVIFAPFRLVIVERPDKIASFIETRIKHMKTNDLGVCSFLHKDEVSYQTMVVEGDNEVQAVSGADVYTGEIRGNLRKALLSRNVPPSLCNTAFTQEKVKALFSENGGEIVSMSLIETLSDDKKPINVLGTIFRRKEK
jgi:hypothetical protein